MSTVDSPHFVSGQLTKHQDISILQYRVGFGHLCWKMLSGGNLSAQAARFLMTGNIHPSSQPFFLMEKGELSEAGNRFIEIVSQFPDRTDSEQYRQLMTMLNEFNKTYQQ